MRLSQYAIVLACLCLILSWPMSGIGILGLGIMAFGSIPVKPNRS
jgi:hypothetical protein